MDPSSVPPWAFGGPGGGMAHNPGVGSDPVATPPHIIAGQGAPTGPERGEGGVLDAVRDKLFGEGRR